MKLDDQPRSSTLSQCDGKLPACSQCLIRRRECPGYQFDLVFRPPLVSGSLSLSIKNRKSTNKRPNRKQTLRPFEVPTIVSQHTAPGRALTWPLLDVLSLCLQNFVPADELFLSTSASASRMRWTWMEIIPQLLTGKNDEALSSSIRALGISIMARGRDGPAPTSCALEAQAHALRAMRKALSQRRTLLSCEKVVSATMCLILSEVWTQCQLAHNYLLTCSE